MGLDTTHDAWHGPYSSFNEWRRQIAKAAGMPPLNDMEGFGGDIPWDEYLNHPLYELLNHSDCDGDIAWDKCKVIADGLIEILPKLEQSYMIDKTTKFIKGLMLAYNQQEKLEFH